MISAGCWGGVHLIAKLLWEYRGSSLAQGGCAKVMQDIKRGRVTTTG